MNQPIIEARKVSEDIKAAASQAVNNASAAATASAQQARRVFDEGSTQARAAMEKGVQHANKTAEGLFKAANEAVEFGRGNLEAFTQSAQAWSTGLQDLTRQYVAVAQGLTDQAMQTSKALAGVKSLKEAADLQTGFARSAVERAVSETTRLQEAAFKLAEQASAPLTQRMTLAFEKLSRPVSA